MYCILGVKQEVINIVNKYTHVPNSKLDVYVGRGSPLGNPRPITDRESRDNVCDFYDIWLPQNFQTTERRALLNKIHRIEKTHGSVNLVCFCFPKRCHAETIKRLILNARA